MSKIDLSFVQTMIDGYKNDIGFDFHQGMITWEAAEAKIEVLDSLSNTLKHFIEDANKLGKKKNESKVRKAR